jgi:hypothetical protein
MDLAEPLRSKNHFDFGAVPYSLELADFKLLLFTDLCRPVDRV